MQRLEKADSNRFLTYDILAKAPTQYKFLILDDVRFASSPVYADTIGPIYDLLIYYPQLTSLNNLFLYIKAN